MNLLPRLLYLFQTALMLLLRSFLRGSVRFADTVSYYRAAHLTRVVDWCCEPGVKLIISAEQDSCSLPLSGVPWIYPKPQGHSCVNPLTNASLRVTMLSFCRDGISSVPSLASPILGKPAFPRESEVLDFAAWWSRGSLDATTLWGEEDGLPWIRFLTSLCTL